MIKTTLIILLLLIGVHLLLYGYLRRRIEAAKRAREKKNDR
jgi:uncharacterized membrane protein YidH (DUF202 family)